MFRLNHFLQSCRRSNEIIKRAYATKKLGGAHYPERLPSIDETAQRLGFEKATDMYPEYPLEEPPMLWMVTQTAPLKYRPYWEKEAMKDMGLYKTHDISVQMNTPSTNEKLWQVKHLTKITPIRFPDGYPTEDDIGGTHLKGDGKFVIYNRLKQEVGDDDLVPEQKLEEWKVVDGYRMCNNCKNRRCVKLGMCQKLWLQRGRNNIERIGPKLFNYVDPKDQVEDPHEELTETQAIKS